MDLGVGKNMVTSISFWLKAFGIITSENQYSDLANYLFREETGKDLFIENIATVWLLHYSLVKTARASIYNLFFNHFRKTRTEFTKEHLLSFIKRIMETENQKNFTENTITNDISVFIRNYLKPLYKESKIDIEEDFSSLLIDLDLMSHFESQNAEGKRIEWYRVESKNQYDLPAELVLFNILETFPDRKSISFNELLTGNNSPGLIFCLTADGLYNKIELLAKSFAGITYTETAGIREIQIKKTLNKWEVLNGYYQI